MALTEQDKTLAWLHVMEGKSLRAAALGAGYSETTASTRVYEWVGNNQNKREKPELKAEIQRLRLALEEEYKARRYLNLQHLARFVDRGEKPMAHFSDEDGFDYVKVPHDVKDWIAAIKEMNAMIGGHAPQKHEHTGAEGGPIETKGDWLDGLPPAKKAKLLAVWYEQDGGENGSSKPGEDTPGDG